MEEQSPYSIGRRIPHGLAQHHADVHEAIGDLNKCSEILVELKARTSASREKQGIVEWSLWSAALVIFFKQFSDNKGRKLKIDYKKVFKEHMDETFSAYVTFKGIRDGYIAHANNEQNRIASVALIDEEHESILGVLALGIYDSAHVSPSNLNAFANMVQITGKWCENKKKQIEKKLLKHLHEQGFGTIAEWEKLSFIQPRYEELITNSRKTV